MHEFMLCKYIIEIIVIVMKYSSTYFLDARSFALRTAISSFNDAIVASFFHLV